MVVTDANCTRTDVLVSVVEIGAEGVFDAVLLKVPSMEYTRAMLIWNSRITRTGRRTKQLEGSNPRTETDDPA
jgi:hypothetical protein